MMFSVQIEATSGGDGNDGFVEAKSITLNTPKSGQALAIDDYADWYKFIVTADTSLSVQLTSDAQLGCIISSLDADYFGFEGPKCNETSTYTPGTYYIGVMHSPSGVQNQTFTLQVKTQK